MFKTEVMKIIKLNITNKKKKRIKNINFPRLKVDFFQNK